MILVKPRSAVVELRTAIVLTQPHRKLIIKTIVTMIIAPMKVSTLIISMMKGLLTLVHVIDISLPFVKGYPRDMRTMIMMKSMSMRGFLIKKENTT